MGATFKTGSGGSPVAYMLSVEKAAQPTAGDLLYAGQRERTRILNRTTKLGVDVDGVTFQHYNTTRPYYDYPGGRVGKTTTQRIASRNRDFRSVVNREDILHSVGRLHGAGAKKTRLGIRYDSYQAYKFQGLGRAVVDLMGRNARMVRAVLVKVGAIQAQADIVVGPTAYPQPATSVTIGLYGEEAIRGSAHNEGVPGRLPRRHWFGANPQDLRAMEREILERRELALAKLRD